jgi:hypothetical protein
MKIIISETQLKQIIESEKKDRLYNIPAEDFVEDYQAIIDTYNRKNKYDGIKIEGDLDLIELDIEDIEKILNEVIIVTDGLDLSFTQIKSLGKLEKVGDSLNLQYTSITSLGNLTEVGGYLFLIGTPLGKKLADSGMSEEEIKNKYGVKGRLYI